MAINYRRYFLIFAFSFIFAVQAFAGPPFKTDDPEPVDYRHWEFYIASEQTFQTNESDATLPHFEVNYGVVPDVQLHIVAPLGYVHTTDGTHYGYSDTELGVKYRFVEETESVPQIGVFPLIEIPTGNADHQLGAGNVQVYVPVWVQKSWGKFTTYAGGGFWYNAGGGQGNSVFSGWEAQYDISDVVTLGGELYNQTSNFPDSESSAGYNFGGFINITGNHHILFSLGHSFSGAASITGYIGYQYTI